AAVDHDNGVVAGLGGRQVIDRHAIPDNKLVRAVPVVVDGIQTAVINIGVASAAPVHEIVARAADQGVRTVAALELVVARPTIDPVVPFITIDFIRAVISVDDVVQGSANGD